jgi:parallel beta-helix repeat protein
MRFDRGNDVLVERVKVTASRGRGIVFDGKNDSWTSLRNTVRDCVIVGTDGDGIEMLASSQNTIQGCTITNVGGHGIQANKSSPTATQPNKKSTDNVITGNRIDQAGQDGINVNGGDRNQITGNVVTNSSDDTSGRDGIRVTSADGVTCDDNVVANNTATDNQTPKTQRYGLNIALAACNRTVVGTGNAFAGNLSGTVKDLGTGTIYH